MARWGVKMKGMGSAIRRMARLNRDLTPSYAAQVGVELQRDPLTYRTRGGVTKVRADPGFNNAAIRNLLKFKYKMDPVFLWRAEQKEAAKIWQKHANMYLRNKNPMILMQAAALVGSFILRAIRLHIRQGRNFRSKMRPNSKGSQRFKKYMDKYTGQLIPARGPMVKTGQLYHAFFTAPAKLN